MKEVPSAVLALLAGLMVVGLGWIITDRIFIGREAPQTIVFSVGMRLVRIADVLRDYVLEKQALPACLSLEGGQTGRTMSVAVLIKTLPLAEQSLAEELSDAQSTGTCYRIEVKADPNPALHEPRSLECRIMSLAKDKRLGSVLPHDDLVLVLHLLDQNGKILFDLKNPTSYRVPPPAESLAAHWAKRSRMCIGIRQGEMPSPREPQDGATPGGR